MPVITSALTTIALGLGATAATAGTIGAIGAAAAYGAGATLLTKKLTAGSSNKGDSGSSTRQQNLEAELAAKNASESGDKTAAASMARQRQKQSAQQASGRSSTILTSPLGDQGNYQGGEKTLLGS